MSFMIKFVFYASIDHEYWFNYDFVKPVKHIFEVGEDLKFESKSVFYRDGHIIWNDILRCKENAGDGFSFYSNFKSENINYKGSGEDAEMTSKKWIYQGNIPKKLAICYLESVIQIELQFGMTKSHTIIGPEFIISPNKNAVTIPNQRSSIN